MHHPAFQGLYTLAQSYTSTSRSLFVIGRVLAWCIRDEVVRLMELPNSCVTYVEKSGAVGVFWVDAMDESGELML